jgi:hypothetical protein
MGTGIIEPSETKRPAKSYPDSRDDAERALGSTFSKMFLLTVAATVVVLAFWVHNLNRRLDVMQTNAHRTKAYAQSQSE